MNGSKNQHTVRSPVKKRRPEGWVYGNWIRPERRQAIYLRDQLLCVYCGVSVDNTAIATLDHLYPKGHPLRTHSDESVVSACVNCNSSKGDIPILEYLENLALEGRDVGEILLRLQLRHTPPDKAAGRERLALLRSSGRVRPAFPNPRSGQDSSENLPFDDSDIPF